MFAFGKSKLFGKIFRNRKCAKNISFVKLGITNDEVREVIGEAHQVKNDEWTYIGQDNIDLKSDTMHFTVFKIHFSNNFVDALSEESMDLLLPSRLEMKK